ncbi:MAG: hypothetical protein K5846_01365 [Bacteroidales bacterium]|nr:hypothetical protein [Bacteroidales bacterium]
MYRNLLSFMLILLFFQTRAQHRDTVIVYETQVVHDTLVVFDTLYHHDTLHWKTSTPSEIHSESGTGADTVVNKKGGQEADWNDKTTWKQSNRKPLYPPFDGFQLGYLFDIGILPSAIVSNSTFIRPKPGVSGHLGLEFSYHFAKYIGISAGLSYGTTGAFRARTHCDVSGVIPFDNTGYSIYSTGFSVPLKLEFHAPISQKVWVTVDAGVRLRMPWYTFITGYDKSVSSPFSLQGLILPDTIDYYDHLKITPAVIDPNRFNIDILANAGIYVQMPHGGLFRWTIGLNCPLNDFASGSYSIRVEHEGDNLLPPQTSPSVQYENGTFRLRSNMFSTQIAFIQTFQKQKRKHETRPNWTSDKRLCRHEIKFDVCDPTGVMLFDRYFVFIYPEGMYPNHAWRSPSFRTTPVFSLSSHYRVAKWFWVGLSLSYAYYTDQQSHLYESGVTGLCERKFHTYAIMPDIRFSYLNRPNVTLYSALSVGMASFFGETNSSNLTYPEHRHPWFSDALNRDHEPSLFSMLHVTLFGLKASYKHFFGSLELGAGYKGLGSIGVGYEF